MYPDYMAVAEKQGEKKALRSMNWALEAEKVHAKLYAAAKQSVEAGKDVAAVDIWVCTVVRLYDGRRAAGRVPGVRCAQGQVPQVLDLSIRAPGPPI